MMRFLLLDVLVVGLALLFTLGVAAIALVGMVGQTIPSLMSGALIVLGAVNLVQLGVLWILLLRNYLQEDDDATSFWTGILIRYAILGGALYYYYGLRKQHSPDQSWPPQGPDPLGWLLRSPVLRIARIANIIWIPLACLLFVLALLFPFPPGWEFLFRACAGLAFGVFALGLLVSSALVVVLIRDAAIKWRGSAAQRAVAAEINSSFYFPRAAERYLRAVEALENASHGEERSSAGSEA